MVTLSFLVAGFFATPPLCSREAPATVTVAKNSHELIEFWANHNWASRTLRGTLSEPDAPHRVIRDAGVSLWRLEGAERLSNDELDRLMVLDLESLRVQIQQNGSRIKLQKVGDARSATNGEFSFENLRAGIYSLQFDWNTLGGRELIDVTEKQPARLQSSLAAFVSTRGYQPPAQ